MPRNDVRSEEVVPIAHVGPRRQIDRARGVDEHTAACIRGGLRWIPCTVHFTTSEAGERAGQAEHGARRHIDLWREVDVLEVICQCSAALPQRQLTARDLASRK